MTDTIPVEYRVLAVEPVRGAGRLVALATVELDIAGLVLELRGLQVVRVPGRLECRTSMWRDPRSGLWEPSMAIPEALGRAVALAVLDEAERLI